MHRGPEGRYFLYKKIRRNEKSQYSIISNHSVSARSLASWHGMRILGAMLVEASIYGKNSTISTQISMYTSNRKDVIQLW